MCSTRYYLLSVIIVYLCSIDRTLSFIRVFRPTAHVVPTTFTAAARPSIRLNALNFGDEEFEDEDDKEKVILNVGNDDDTQREFSLETTGVGPEVYAKLAPILENLVTKFVSLFHLGVAFD